MGYNQFIFYCILLMFFLVFLVSIGVSLYQGVPIDTFLSQVLEHLVRSGSSS